MKIPKGWLDFKPYCAKVEGTQLFPFKTPLRAEITCGRIPEEQWFTPALLIDVCPKLKLVIDLTNNENPKKRNYSPDDFEDANIKHLRIRIPGGGKVPSEDLLRRFYNVVDEFVDEYSNDPDALVGVHCTHGLNRTGYFICKYMVTRMKYKPEEAIDRFQKARGHKMYRQNFVADIMRPGIFNNKKINPDYSRPPPKVSSAGSSRGYQSRHSRATSPEGQSSSHQENWRIRDPVVSVDQKQVSKSFNIYKKKMRRDYDDSEPFTGNFHRNPKIFGDDY